MPQILIKYSSNYNYPYKRNIFIDFEKKQVAILHFKIQNTENKYNTNHASYFRSFIKGMHMVKINLDIHDDVTLRVVVL